MHRTLKNTFRRAVISCLFCGWSGSNTNFVTMNKLELSGGVCLSERGGQWLLDWTASDW